MHPSIRQERELSPEQAYGGPSREAMYKLKLVVHPGAYARMCHCDYGDEQDIENDGDDGDTALVPLQFSGLERFDNGDVEECEP